jgi:hypothetical protein
MHSTASLLTPYALRFTLYALRFTLYALRFTLYALRFTLYALKRKITIRSRVIYFFPLKNPKWARMSLSNFIRTSCTRSGTVDSIFSTKK